MAAEADYKGGGGGGGGGGGEMDAKIQIVRSKIVCHPHVMTDFIDHKKNRIIWWWLLLSYLQEWHIINTMNKHRHWSQKYVG